MSEYKISLGVKLNIDDIRKQVRGAEHGLKKINIELNTKKIQSQLNSIRKQIQGLSRIKVNLNSNNNVKNIGIGGKGGIKGVADEANKTYNSLSNLAKRASSIKLKVDTNAINNQMSVLETKFGRLKTKSTELSQGMELVRNAQKNLNSAIKEGNPENIVSAYQKWNAVLKDVTNQTNIQARAEKQVADAQKLAQSRTNLSLNMSAWLKNNSAAAKEFGGRIKQLQAELKACDNTRLTGIRSEFQSIQREAALVGKAGLSFGDRLKSQFKQYSSYVSVASLFSYATQGLRSMFEQVKLIDSAMTELKKVTNETSDSYNHFLSNAASRATKIGTTIDGLVKSTADFARLGYGFEDAQGLAEVANIYAVVGDEIEGVEGATQSLISTMAAFKDEMNGMSNSDFAMSIVDKFNEIGNNFAISSGGIGEAFTRSASSMAAANNTLDETIALITAANTVVQDPDVVGTAFKTMSMRIRGAKTEMEEAGLETEGMVESTAKLREEIMALSGVDIMLNDNEFKSTYQILEELADKWQDLTDIQQASLTELIAGKRQGNIVSSLMTNFDTARDALETSLNSSGSAMREHEKWQQSLEAQLNKLKAAWQGLSQAFLSSDFLKGALDLVIGLVNGITSLIDTFGALGVIGLGVAGKGIFNHFKKDKKTITDVANSLEHLTNVVQNSTNATNAQTKANDANTASEAAQAKAKDVNTASEATNTKAKNDNTASEVANTKANDANTASEVAETQANDANTTSEIAETDVNIANTASEVAETKVNYDAAASELAEAAANAKSAASELAEAKANATSGASEVVGTGAGLGSKLKTGLGGMLGGVGNAIKSHPIAAIIGAAILAIVGLYKAQEKAKEVLAEKVEDITTKYEEESAALTKLKNNYDTLNENSLVSRYEKLSKGVNSLGENVSLTADEYSEYHDVVNAIAEQIPSVVSGYDEQGNAILDCAGNVDTLTEAYRQLIKEQNQEVLNAGKDIFKDFENDIKDSSIYNRRSFTNEYGNLEYIEYYDTRHLDNIKNLLNTKNEDVNYYLKSLSEEELSRISSLLDEYGYERDVMFKDGFLDFNYEGHYEHVARAFKESRTTMEKILREATDDIDALSNDAAAFTEAYIGNAFLDDYSHLSDNIQDVIKQATSGLGTEFYAQFFDREKYKTEEDSIAAIEEHLDSMLQAFDKLDDYDSSNFEAAFELRTKFNNGEISYGEFVNGTKDVVRTINSLDVDQEIKNQLKLSLNAEEVLKDYEALKTRLTSEEYNIQMSDEEAQNFLHSLSASEYAVAIKLIADEEVDWSKFDVNSLRKYIKEEAKLQDALNYTIAIDVETESIEALNTAMAESVSATGLSSEAIAALKGRYSELESQGYNLSAMFEETANGIHLNREAVSEFEQKLASDKLTETDKQLEVLKDRYDDLTTEIDNCTDAGDRAALYREQQTIIDKINDLATLASQYEGLTSAYQAWQSVESAGSERNMYESIIEGFENIGDEISRGWYDDGTIKFLELMTGQTDLAGESASKLKEIWNGLDDNIKNTSYSVKDFFTTDEDGNSTSTGVYNFLRALQELESSDTVSSVLNKQFKNIENIEDLVTVKDGKITAFNFDVVGGDEAIAEALGISEELVQIMLRAADDAGFVVNLDGAYTQLADLKTAAETARDTLISLQKDGMARLKGWNLNFNFDAVGDDLVAEQGRAVKVLDRFKTNGKINLELEGAEQALDIAEYLTIKLDEATEPKFMQIDTSKVDKNLQKPVEKIQEIGNLCKEKHLVTLTGDTKELERVQDEINTAAQEIEKYDPEIKAKIGVDKKWDAKTIADKIEKGEIEIPAELKLDVQMSDDLKDMRLMMMKQLGLVSDNEVKLKVGYDIDDSVVDELTDEQKEVVIKYLAEHEEVDGYTPEQKEALVKYIADGGELDDYTPEEKQAIVEYLVDGGNIDDYTPEEKQAIVEYLTDTGEPDKWTPEQKEAIAKFKKDSSEVDRYSPEDKQAIAKFIKNSIEPDIYQPPDKTQEVVANLDSSEPDNYQPEDKKFTVKAILQKIGDWTNNLLSGGSKRKIVNGTANVNGTTGRAFKHGDWSTKDSGTALVGELGTETLVRNGRYYTIGDTGAEFIHYEKGDIIFNHKQTEELFRYGKVTSGGGRGKAFVNGTAFVSGTAFSNGSGGGEEPSRNSVTGKKYSKSSSSSSSSDDFEETFDWIEIAIDRIERAIDRLDQKASGTWRSWSDRNKSLKDEISKIRDEIDLQNKAYNKYMAAANGVGLSNEWKKKVQDGEIDFSTIKDETLAEKIKDYQEYYEKAMACKDAVLDLEDAEAEAYSKIFDLITAKYDAILQKYEHAESMLNEYIAQSEARGHVVSKQYYQELIKNERASMIEMRKQRDEMIKARDEAVASGAIVEGSEEWHNMTKQINDINLAIEQGETSLIEYANAMREIDWQIFDMAQERISNLTDEANFLIDLMSNKKLYDENGQMTEEGRATMGLHGQNYNVHMAQADNYAKEIERLNQEIAKDPYNQTLLDRRQELIELQRESILAAEDEKQAIKDMVAEGIEIELDALQERIDKYNEAIESQKSLYDYQKKVKEQTKEIASIEKQLAAYAGDDSEEIKSKVQELRVSLEEAKENLKETEYDKYISDQQQLLDELYLEYETVLNARLDNIDALMSDMISGINENASEINATLATQAENVGATLSDEMQSIWNTGSDNMKGVLSTYGEGISGGITTVNATLDKINTGILEMVAALDDEAEENTSSGSGTTPPSGGSNPSNGGSNPSNGGSTTPSTPNTPNNPNNSNGANKANFFIKKKNTYPKNKLNKDKSITDRLKYFDFDSSFKAREKYYKAMGFSDKYKGSAAQNSKMIAWMKKNGYAEGKRKLYNNELAWTQEKGMEYIIRPSDGAILTPLAKNDSVLNAKASKNIWDMANSPAEFIKDNLSLDASILPYNSNSQNVYHQHLDNVVISLPNVKNYDEFLGALQKDKKFEKLILSMSNDRLAGKSSLAKNKSIR